MFKKRRDFMGGWYNLGRNNISMYSEFAALWLTGRVHEKQGSGTALVSDLPCCQWRGDTTRGGYTNECNRQ